MARLMGGGGIADFCFTLDDGGDMQPAVSTVVTFWTALTGGSQVGAAPVPDDGTGLVDGTGNPISSVTTDSSGHIPGDSFQFPDGVSRLAADANGGSGPRQWVTPNDPVSLTLDLDGTVAGVQAEADGLTTAMTGAPMWVVANPDGSWPGRPSTTRWVIWYQPWGGGRPAVGGSGSLPGDLYLGP